MARDVTRSDIRRMLERLNDRADQVDPGDEPPDGGPSTSNPWGRSGEDDTPTASDHAKAIMADLSVEQLAKFVAIARDFDDTDPGAPDHGEPGEVNKEAIVPLTSYSRRRAPDADGPSDYLSEADQARLEVLTGGAQWIEVGPEDMAAARQIADGM